MPICPEWRAADLACRRGLDRGRLAKYIKRYILDTIAPMVNGRAARVRGLQHGQPRQQPGLARKGRMP